MGLEPRVSKSTSLASADDFSLMAAVRARNAEAMGTLYDRYSGVVYGLCRRALADPRDAEDLLIEIFAEIWERGDRYDPERGSPVGHIMGLARSRLIDRLRSRRSSSGTALRSAGNVAAAGDLTEKQAGPLTAAIDAEQGRKINQAMNGLPPDQRQALELAYFEALSHSEIAQRLGQPLGTVKSRIRQALIQLRSAFASGD